MIKLFLLATCAVGDRVFRCFYGAGLFPGWRFAVHTGSHGYHGGHGMHRTNQRFPRHHLLRLYRSDPTDLRQIYYHVCTVGSETDLVCLCDAAGLHVFPTFVLYELTILLVLTLTLVIMKVEHCPLFSSTLPHSHFLLTLPYFSFSFQFVMAVLVLSAILPPSSRHIRWVVSAGLAQVSEFSFVLSSRARRAGIISREVSDSYLRSIFIFSTNLV